ncbi:hypothetical protein JQX13_28885 [Archangium violaceum]|nr:hypothetical protein JQX13_28885 [Archangium violaceum]
MQNRNVAVQAGVRGLHERRGRHERRQQRRPQATAGAARDVLIGVRK